MVSSKKATTFALATPMKASRSSESSAKEPQDGGAEARPPRVLRVEKLMRVFRNRGCSELRN